MHVNDVGNYEVIFPFGDGQISFGYHTTEESALRAASCVASWVEEGWSLAQLKCFYNDLRVRLSQVRCSYISNHSYTDLYFRILYRRWDESKDKHKKDNEAREFRRKDRRRRVALLLHHNFV